MKYIHFVVKLVLLVMLIGMLSGCAQDTNKQQTDRIAKLEQQVAALESENASLKAQNLATATEEEKEALREDLISRTDLIPVEAVLGGTMRYYPDEIVLFGENYAYAYAEDGHVSVEMIFSYIQTDDGAVDWQLELYNTGNGWEAAR